MARVADCCRLWACFSINFARPWVQHEWNWSSLQSLKTWCWVLSDSARKYDHLTAQEVDELKSSGRPMLNVFPAERPRTDDLDKGGKTPIHMILFHSFVFSHRLMKFRQSCVLNSPIVFALAKFTIISSKVCFTWYGYVCSQITFWNLAQLLNANPTNIHFSSANSDGYTAPDICPVCHWNDSTFSSLGPV